MSILYIQHMLYSKVYINQQKVVFVVHHQSRWFVEKYSAGMSDLGPKWSWCMKWLLGYLIIDLFTITIKTRIKL